MHTKKRAKTCLSPQSLTAKSDRHATGPYRLKKIISHLRPIGQALNLKERCKMKSKDKKDVIRCECGPGSSGGGVIPSQKRFL